MKPEFKTRLQEVYTHILNGANQTSWSRGFAIKLESSARPDMVASGFIDNDDVEPHDICFMGNPGCRIPEVEAFVKSIDVGVIERGDTIPLFNTRRLDIRMPKFSAYISPGAYYSDLLHEVTHFGRFLLQQLGSKREGADRVCFEEMIAQLGSELLMTKFGLCNTHSTASYVGGYMDMHTSPDRRALFNDACSRAVEAVEAVEKFATI